MKQKFKKMCVCLVLLVAVFSMVACGEEEFVPELPVPLSAELEARIKQDYFDIILPYSKSNSGLPEPSMLIITYYWGTYNGSVYFMTECDFGHELWAWKYTVAGYEFASGDFDTWVWNDGNFYGLGTAYELGLLTEKDIRNIAALSWENVEYNK